MIKRTLYGIILLSVCASLVSAATTVAATPVPYVALGDSFSSGEGNMPLDGRCHRARRDAYPRVLPSLVGYISAPQFHACTGATVADVWQRPQPKRDDQKIQLEYLSPSARLVTLTIGGNDLGFRKIVARCLWIDNCVGSKAGDESRAGLQTIKDRLIDVYVRVRDRMDPGGQLLVAGYPHLFIAGPDANCNPLISNSDAAFLNSLVEKGNRRIAEAVRAVDKQRDNVTYIDVTERFASHGLCSEEPWLWGIKVTQSHGLIKGSYHPRPSGQQAYAEAFATYLRQPAVRAALGGPAR